jgi:hypothetical protein
MKYLIARLLEKSTWGGIVLFAASYFSFKIPTDAVEQISQGVVLLISGLMVVIKERKKVPEWNN